MTSFDEVLDRIKKATGARTQVELANLLGIRQSSISDAKRRNSVPADWYMKLYRSLGLNPEWLSDGIEPMYLKPGMGEAHVASMAEPAVGYGKSPARSRVVNVSSMTGASTKEGSWQPDFISQLAIPETFYRPTLLALKIEGSGMEPLIRRGAYVGLDMDQRRILSGELYGVHVPHEGLVLKRVFFDAENNRFILRSENPIHPEQYLSPELKDKQLVGRIVWVLQDI
ncbi:helix-turn-helix domain-containing protein [Desulfocurvibacter africanus]|uniref:CI repressor n=1 Tax=Desulfocurvibacter africanus subsp. africanus str. Walvis Bay TaxID=690850 RepID=F3YUG2_DESAF|nr:helix-turn-helix domain-containing protein [Desulfocurvibacter africanus]EGJ48844.1 CI repressor [Desulfocurvibacter africanus subsp. africanus str. Walvis Bay]